MNEIIWLIVLLTSLLGVSVAYKSFGKIGLYIWSVLAVVIANIQATKVVHLFGYDTSLGIIIFSTTFLAINIINEKYGKKEAKNAVLLTFGSLLLFTILMNFSVLYNPAIGDTGNDAIKLIFSLNIKIFIASAISFLSSHFFNLFMYQFLQKKYKKPWVSNLISTICAQLIDTTLFIAISLTGVLPINVIINYFVIRILLKLIVAIFSTPVMLSLKK